MTVFRALVAAVQVVLVVSFACVLLMVVVPFAFILLVFLVPEETMTRAMSIFILTFLALVLITLVVAAVKGLWRWVMARKDRS
jgi:hypothetical protein